ncbi:MAG: FIST C-terminal domain-containing protein [Proteobacteria bacterium]|nr:FIST C-terminal domain-containing protein [Pseudomonadota bacterium]
MKVIDLAHLDLDAWNNPKALLIYATQPMEPHILCEIRERYPEMTIIGMSSSLGIFQPDGFSRGAYGLLFFEEDGVSSRSMLLDFEGVSDVRETVARALARWKSPRSPAKLYIMPTPGQEERIIEGICDVFTDAVHIFGATAGHDKFLESAYVFLNDTRTSHGVVITELVTGNFFCMVTCGGYLATPRQGTVTAAEGRRLVAINGMPAAEVYNDWTNRRFDAYIQRGGELPRSAGLYPLGRTITSEPECGYWLSHPFQVDAQGAIQLFSEIPVGAEIHLMRATENALVEHVVTAVETSIRQVRQGSISAVMIMYCAGCASIISENMPDISHILRRSFGSIPFIGCVTLGEQGRLLNAHHNYHGNMMIGINLILQ